MTKVLELFGEPIAMGGEESYVFDQLSEMDHTDLSFDFLTPYNCINETKREIIKAWGGSLFELNCDFLPGRSRESVKKPLTVFFSGHHYDVVHIHSGSTSFLAIASIIAKREGTPRVIVHSHCAVEHMSLLNRINRRVCGIRMSHSVDKYCACSREAAQAKFCPEVMSQVTFLKNGIRLKEYSASEPTRKRIRLVNDIDDNEFILGHVGRFTYQKNQQFALSVFEKIHRSNKNTKLWFIGDGPDRGKVENEVKSMSLKDSVKFFGAVDNPASIYQAFDGFIFPSHYEGFGLALLEAEAMGLPCAAAETVPRFNTENQFVTYLPLDDISPWCDFFLRNFGRRNLNAIGQIKKTGLDAKDTSRVLRALYQV